MSTRIIATVAAFAALLGTSVTWADSLDFSTVPGRQVTVKYNGEEMSFRYFENIIYVAHPVDTNYQRMNIFIPEEYFNGGSVNGYTTETAPIFFPNSIGGYMPSAPRSLESLLGQRGGRGNGGPRPGNGEGRPGNFPHDARPPRGVNPPQTGGNPPQGAPGARPEGAGPQGPRNGMPPVFEINDDETRINTVLAALKRGYVVACPGARGRTEPSGRAPAAIVDLKAAVRYLKSNDAVMPGDASRIISNGTSAGGAMSSLLGATGNHPDYEPYLKALGAAEATDDIFAAQCYCPITNLEHADAAYEWTFNALGSSRKGEITADMKAISDDLKALFPAYINSLGYKDAAGAVLRLDDNGEGSFKDWVCHFLRESAQKQLDAGADLSSYDWIEVKDGKAGAIDFGKYAGYCGRLKAPIAFDSLNNDSAENNEFGDEKTEGKHFTGYAFEHSTTETPFMAAADKIRMLNPMNYVADDAARTAVHWRICHGTKDSDTSLAVPVLLATSLLNNGCDVTMLMAWDKPHSGDYDLPDLFDWIDSLCK